MMNELDTAARCFIDDSYLWTSLANQQILAQAIKVSALWDQLTGQLLNQRKSEVWSSHPEGRKSLKQQLPNMNLVHILEVLGSRIQTANQQKYAWPKAKTSKIVAEAGAIPSLPASVEIKQHIVAAKLLPRLASCHAST